MGPATVTLSLRSRTRTVPILSGCPWLCGTIVLPEARHTPTNALMMEIAILIAELLIVVVGDDPTKPLHRMHHAILFGLLVFADGVPIAEPPLMLGCLLNEFEEHINLSFLAERGTQGRLNALSQT